MRRLAASVQRLRAAVNSGSCGVELYYSFSSSCTPQEAVTASLGYERETIYALPRSAAGSNAVKQYRKAGRVPAILFSLPGETNELISLDLKDTESLLRTHGRSGLASRLFSLHVIDDQQGQSKAYPVLPKMIHRNAVTETVENITFMFCPPDRIVNVNVPIKIMGEDVSPGVKKGGFVNVIRRRIKCKCLGSCIPASIEVDVSSLNLGDRVGLETLNLPPGVVIAEKHIMDPVCKIAGKAARE